MDLDKVRAPGTPYGYASGYDDQVIRLYEIRLVCGIDTDLHNTVSVLGLADQDRMHSPYQAETLVSLELVGGCNNQPTTIASAQSTPFNITAR